MNRIERCNEKFKELFGGKPVENEGTDAEFMRILQRYIFGEVCYIGSLDNKMRELITITVLAVNQTLPQLKAHINACLHVGCTPVEIREVIYELAPFIGFPKTLNAIAAIDEVFAEQGIALPLENQETVTEENRHDVGLNIQKEIYGTEIREKYSYLPSEYADAVPRSLTELCFGDLYSRTGLDLKTRELLSVVALSALGGADMQVRSHIIGAVKAGNTKEEVLCALLHAGAYMGFPRLFNALNASEDIFSQQA